MRRLCVDYASIKSWSVTIQIEATEQYVPVVLFVALYKMVYSSFSWSL